VLTIPVFTPITVASYCFTVTIYTPVIIELSEYKSFEAIGAFLHCPRFSALTMLSTLHRGAAREGDKKKKPETVLYYNRNKCGVDVLDNMRREMSTKKKAAWIRWLLAVFFNILDLAGVNA